MSLLNDGLPVTLIKMGMVTSNPILPTPHPCFILVYDFCYFLSFFFKFLVVFFFVFLSGYVLYLSHWNVSSTWIIIFVCLVYYYISNN